MLMFPSPPHPFLISSNFLSVTAMPNLGTTDEETVHFFFFLNEQLIIYKSGRETGGTVLKRKIAIS